MKNAWKLARGLGWFSIGLGLTELLAGRRLARALGMEPRSGLLRFYGLREIAAGVGILANARRAPEARWVWARVAGDVLDLATLLPTLRRSNPQRGAAAFATANVAAVTALDVICAQQLSAA